MNISSLGPAHRLKFMNCSSTGASHEVQSFRNRLLVCGFPPGSKVLPANLLQYGLLSKGPARSLLQHRLSMRSQPPFGVSTCSSMGSSMGCRGTACPTMVFIMGCRGISALPPEATPPLPSSLTLMSSEFSQIVSLLSSSCCCAGVFCFPLLLNYVISEALPPSLMALARGESILEPADIGSVRHWGSF